MDNDFGPPQKVSYLQARDPSILSWNKMQVVREEVRKDLQPNFEEVSDLPLLEKDNLINVFLRIKYTDRNFSDLYEIDGNNFISKIEDGRNGEHCWKKYEFSKIFGPDVSQQDLFDGVVKPKILKFINGENCTLMAYGASGAGKTFTMAGTAEQPGIIPRALEYLFKTLPAMKEEPDFQMTSNRKLRYLDSHTSREMERKNTQSLIEKGHVIEEYKMELQTYKVMQSRLSNNPFALIDGAVKTLGVWVSFAEIYNELLYDLLQQPPPRGHPRRNLKVGGHSGHTYIKGLNHFYVRSSIEAYSILQYGLQNLKYAETALNSHSSRSHSIFSILLVQGSTFDPDKATVSVFNFCDLAGSERLKKTMNVGSRLKESNNINSSLMVLGRCIKIIREGQMNKENQSIPPFRDSKLTQLFQNALAGNEDIMLIVNINTTKHMFEETQHVLNFSSIAKTIEVKERKPKKVLQRVNETEEEFEVLRQRLNEVLRENIELKEENENLQLTNDDLRDELAERELQYEEWKHDAVEKFSERLEIERNHISKHLNALINSHEATIKDLREQNKKLQQDYEMIKNQLPSSTSQDSSISTDSEDSVVCLDSSTSNNGEND